MNVKIAVSGLILGLSLVAIRNVQAQTPLSPVDMTSDEIKEYSKLAPIMAKISARLSKDVPTSALKDNVKFIETRMEEDFGPEFRGYRAQVRKAMQLFISLGDVALKCDVEGYDILSRNYVAIKDNRSAGDRVNEIFDQVRKDHAKTCLNSYKLTVDLFLQHVPKNDMAKLESAFNDLVGEDFVCADKQNSEPAPDTYVMSTPEFRNDCSKSALNKIATSIAKQVKEGNPELWSSLKPVDSTRFGISHTKQPEIPESVFDDYLFKPCKKFMHKLTDSLTPARFDATSRESFTTISPEEYISGDKAFYQALIFNRFCRSLVRDQEKLYKPLRKAWKSSSESL